MQKKINTILFITLLFWLKPSIAITNFSDTGDLLDENENIFLEASSKQQGVYDPWEKVNRKIFHFNDQVDQALVKPVATAYRDSIPHSLRSLVTNFFNNLSDVKNGINALLQLKMGEAAISTGRFVINSTIGMLGMLDVAKEVGLEQKYQDFGLTLAYWQVPDGPYVVLPFWGPKSFRAALGFWPDLEMNPTNNVIEWWTLEFMALHAADIIDTRANLLDAESLVIGDRYSFIRDAYMQQRNILITGELPEDEF